MTNSNEKVMISVEDVHKEFVLPQHRHNSFKQSFVNIIQKNNKTTQRVLDGVSFEVNKGDFFGVVGRNGSGKSTLLKLLAGVYTPTSGEIKVNGKLTPFIELGVGFNPELSGRDNVFLNGALLGFNRKQVSAMYDDIVEFAELEPFMDQKLKNYSSGMQVRLAFSIAIRAKADILVLDEVLAVGDEAFQRKCNDYFNKIRNDKDQTVILVTHSMEAVKKYCNRALLIKDGEIVKIGNPEDIANEYSIENLESTINIDRGMQENSTTISNFSAALEGGPVFSQGEQISITVEYDVEGDVNTYVVADMRDLDRNAPIITAGSKRSDKAHVKKTWRVTLDSINNTNAIVNLVVRDDNNELLYYLPEDKCPKLVLRRTDYPDPKKPTVHAMLFDKGEWK